MTQSISSMNFNLSEKMFWVRDYDLDKLKMNIINKNGETDEDNVIQVKDVRYFIKRLKIELGFDAAQIIDKFAGEELI